MSVTAHPASGKLSPSNQDEGGDGMTTDWRGETLDRVRSLIEEATPKWPKW
jgi:hypothetical protein